MRDVLILAALVVAIPIMWKVQAALFRRMIRELTRR